MLNDATGGDHHHDFDDDDDDDDDNDDGDANDVSCENQWLFKSEALMTIMIYNCIQTV